MDSSIVGLDTTRRLHEGGVFDGILQWETYVWNAYGQGEVLHFLSPIARARLDVDGA